jgi:hypothetical protein
LVKAYNTFACNAIMNLIEHLLISAVVITLKNA